MTHTCPSTALSTTSALRPHPGHSTVRSSIPEAAIRGSLLYPIEIEKNYYPFCSFNTVLSLVITNICEDIIEIFFRIYEDGLRPA